MEVGKRLQFGAPNLLGALGTPNKSSENMKRITEAISAYHRMEKEAMRAV